MSSRVIFPHSSSIALAISSFPSGRGDCELRLCLRRFQTFSIGLRSGGAWRPNHLWHFVSLVKCSSVICPMGRSAVLHNPQSMPSLPACFMPERPEKWLKNIGNITACSYVSPIISVPLEMGSLLPSQDPPPDHNCIFFWKLRSNARLLILFFWAPSHPDGTMGPENQT